MPNAQKGIRLFLRRNEIDTVVAAHKDTDDPSILVNLAIFRLSCCIGLRRLEISRLNLRHVVVAMPDPEIVIPPSVAAKVGGNKNQRGRVISLKCMREVYDDLSHWKMIRMGMGAEDDDPFVCKFKGPHVGQRLTPDMVGRRWSTALKRGLPEDRARQLSVHKGRHTFCTWMVHEKGLVAAQEAAGHSNVATTNYYLHNVVEEEGWDDIFMDPVRKDEEYDEEKKKCKAVIEKYFPDRGKTNGEKKNGLPFIPRAKDKRRKWKQWKDKL